MELIKCKYCESEFEPLTDRQKFCSASCRIKYGNAKQRSQMQGKVYEKVVKCVWCNSEFTRLSTSRSSCQKRKPHSRASASRVK